jgi:hypothetical protein
MSSRVCATKISDAFSRPMERFSKTSTILGAMERLDKTPPRPIPRHAPRTFTFEYNLDKMHNHVKVMHKECMIYPFYVIHANDVRNDKQHISYPLAAFPRRHKSMREIHQVRAMEDRLSKQFHTTEMLQLPKYPASPRSHMYSHL